MYLELFAWEILYCLIRCTSNPILLRGIYCINTAEETTTVATL